MKLFSRSSIYAWTEIKKKQKVKRPYPVTDRPDTKEIGFSHPRGIR